MKRAALFALLAMLAMATALSEEAFFAEEAFDTVGSTLSEDSFFEESFFGGEDFFGEAAIEIAPPEDAAGEAAEDRSLVMTYTDNSFVYSSDTESWMLPVDGLVATASPKKANQVELTWNHTDYSGKPVKLPKNVKYVVYEQDDTQSGTRSGSYAWIQVAVTTKRKVTLKNQISGYHYYAVRAERIEKQKEEYGKLSGYYAQAQVTNSVMWKTISRMSLRQETTSSSATLYLSYVMAEHLSGMSCQYAWRAKINKKWTAWTTGLVSMGYSTVYENGKPTFHTDNQSIDVTSAVNAGADQFEVTLTPYDQLYGQGNPGKTKKASLKFVSGSDDWKAAPEILSCIRTEGGVRLTWRHDATSYFGSYFEVYDGKQLAQRCYAAKENGMRSAYVPLSAGKHKLTVRAVYGQDAALKGNFSAAQAIAIPKPELDYPVITYASVDKSDGYISIQWACQNPDIYQFWVYAGSQEISDDFIEGISLNDENPTYFTPYYSVVALPGKQYKYGTYFDTIKGNAAPYYLVVQGVTPDGKVFTSDVVRISSSISPYNRFDSTAACTADEVRQLAR